MDDAQLHAYGLMAQAIARHLYAWAEHDDAQNRTGHPDAPYPLFYNYSTSTLELASDCLAGLRIFTPIGAEDGFVVFFAFACDLDQAKLVAERNWQGGPTFDELLVAFLDLFGWHGSTWWGFSTERDTPFGLGSRIERTLEALASLGYLTKSELGYVWTELPLGAMREAGFWQEDNEA